MGGKLSVNKVRHDFCQTVVTFDETRRSLCLFYADDSLRQVLRQTVNGTWEVASREKRNEKGRFQLVGELDNYVTNIEDLGTCLRSLCDIIAAFHRNGWAFSLYTNTTLIFNTCSLVFERFNPPLTEEAKEPQVSIAALQLEQPNMVTLLGGLAHGLWELLVDTVNSIWNDGADSVEEDADYCWGKMTLNGKPWCAKRSSQNAESSKLTILGVIREFEERGWSLFTSLTPHTSLLQPSALFFRFDPAAPAIRKNFFFLGLESYDSLYVVDAPLQCVAVLRKCVGELWQEDDLAEVALQETARGKVHEFHLDGAPWFSRGVDGIKARDFLCKVLEALRKTGWKLQAALNFNRSPSDVACLCLGSEPPRVVTYMALSFVSDKILRFVGADAEEMALIRGKLKVACPKSGIKFEEYKSSHQFLFPKTFVNTPEIVSLILEMLRQLQWTAVVSTNVSKLYAHDVDTKTRVWSNTAHTVFFEKDFVEPSPLPENTDGVEKEKAK